nr:PREDICTED: uncharacterized protein LOC108206335 [Daucus carota subsp. sativus]
MSGSTVEHFTHPKHPLRLKEDDVIESDATCSVCDQSVIGSPTYTCSRNYIACQKFYLHKSCAQLPAEIVRPMKDPHPLALQRRSSSSCNICRRRHLRVTYACEDCDFDICVICAFAFENRVISHQGHPEHTLTLQRQALFSCDACYEKTEDYSYVCLPCDFWCHKKCAAFPPIVPSPTYHHHPLTLIFSIPLEHRYFSRHCAICKERIGTRSWSYYCHTCTFFVHMKCSTSTISFQNEMEENVIVDNNSDLVQFPLPGVESLFDFIITQCSKFQVEIQGDDENRATLSTVNDDPHIIVRHWSHREHPLERLHFTVSVDENDDDNNNDNDVDKRALICDGCVQPITISHPSYYACVECGFFLHSFCANKMPRELPAGASPFHPHHSLLLNQLLKFYSFVQCVICNSLTNGFYYECKTCDIKVDLRCVFLPTRVRHQSHKHHSLIQRPSTSETCPVSGFSITDTLVYACETCSSVEISICCAFYPSRMKHKYDDHSLILRLPPFFYEGVFYCQICEEQVNNQWWLYHCDKCDQSFHDYCQCSYNNVKPGGTIKHSIDNKPHTLALVLKTTTRRKTPPFSCAICGHGYRNQFFFECDGCGYLACVFCIRRVHGANKF